MKGDQVGQYDKFYTLKCISVQVSGFRGHCPMNSRICELYGHGCDLEFEQEIAFYPPKQYANENYFVTFSTHETDTKRLLLGNLLSVPNQL